MSYWLFKSEPSNFSIDDLARNKITSWDGVRNYQARNFLRDQVQLGDFAFFYHSSCKTPGIVGTMEIIKAGYPDLSALNIDSPYYDPKSSADNCRWFMVDVRLCNKFAAAITLELIKQQPKLSNMILLRPGNRLSIMPVTLKEWNTIISLANHESLNLQESLIL